MDYSPAIVGIIDWPFVYLANALGSSVDELKLIISFLLSYPLTGILKRIPDAKPGQKNLFIIGVSLFYIIGLYSLWSGLLTLFWSAFGAYAISYFIQGPFMPWIGFVFLMGHMSINHIERQVVNDSSRVDITGAQMVLVMKLTAFCWNVHDGRIPDSDLSDFQKERQIKRLPDFLDYAGYVLFFPGLFAGPAFDYSDYKSYITTTMFELPKGIDPSKAPPTRRQRKIPRSGTPAMYKMAEGLIWIVGFLQFSGYYPSSFLLSDDYMKYGFIRRVWILYMRGLTARMKYYGVWALTEGACILSGIGYRGVDKVTGKAQWDRLTNVKPLEIEFAQNVRAYLGGWNINTNSWLRNYVYLRVTPKGQKPGFLATLATFVTSAFWHGFYPGYYLAFVLAAMTQDISKHGRRLLRPFFMSADGKTPTANKRYYDTFCWFITQVHFSFVVVPFLYLTLPSTIKIWTRVYFYGIVGVAVCFAFLQSPGKAFLVKKLKANTRPGLERTDSSSSVADGMQSTLGLPHDPEFQWQQIVTGVKGEMEARKRRGSTVPDLRVLLQQKLDQFKQDQQMGRKTPIDGIDLQGLKLGKEE